MDLSDFPMDRQTCPLMIGSFGYMTKDIIYEWDKEYFPNEENESGVSIASNMKLSQFDLIETPIDNATLRVNKGGICIL